MAYADYRLCDKCDSKAFYDSDLSYEGPKSKYDPDSFRVQGENQIYGASLGYLGDWAVLCKDCAKTHKTVIVPIEETPRDIQSAPKDGSSVRIVPCGYYTHAFYQDGFWWYHREGEENYTAGPEPEGWYA